MDQYHKIQTVFKRDPETKFKTLLDGEFSLPEFAHLADCVWDFTEKVDGTNIRVKWDGVSEVVDFAGKTDRAQIPPQLLARLKERFTHDAMAYQFGDSTACLYGEGYGAKIQKGGGNYRPDQDFVLFDVKVGDLWLRRESVLDVSTGMNIDIVPVIASGTLAEMIAMAREGFDSQWGDFWAEGIVARPSVDLLTRTGERIITKIKSKDFRRV